MKKTIFDYLDYQKYLQDQIDARPGAGRGFRSLLAKHLGCQRSFISQVLQKKMHFSLEQAQRLSALLGHSRDELDFLLLLVQFARAGNTNLKEYFLDKIKQALLTRLKYDKRLKSDNRLSYENQVQYYGAWYYGAICVALGVPELRTAEALSRRLSIPLKTVRDALDFLEKCGLIQKKGEHYESGPHHVHLGDDSALLARFHTNWRVRAITALQQEGPRDLHFSGSVTLSKDDAYKLQAHLVAYIEELQKKVISSPDETVAALCFDFFEL